MKAFIIVLFCGLNASGYAQGLKLAQLQYSGGGDYYANTTALKNLSVFCNNNLKTEINSDYEYVKPNINELLSKPFIHLTGHGNVVFSASEREALRKYLLNGGFLHIDDNYGMDEFIRPEIQKIFPEKNLELVPLTHPIYNAPYKMEGGLPKIHEHDGKATEGWGIFHEGELILFYSYESDLSDGWENKEVHNDPDNVRLSALQMGANLVHYAFTRQIKL
jgi:hypothetical protein